MVILFHYVRENVWNGNIIMNNRSLNSLMRLFLFLLFKDIYVTNISFLKNLQKKSKKMAKKCRKT